MNKSKIISLFLLVALAQSCDYKESEKIEKMGLLASVFTGDEGTKANISLFKGAYGIKLSGEDRITVEVDGETIEYKDVTKQTLFPNYIYNFSSDKIYPGKKAIVTFHRSNNRKFVSSVVLPESKLISPEHKKTYKKDSDILYYREGRSDKYLDMINLKMNCDGLELKKEQFSIKSNESFNPSKLFNSMGNKNCDLFLSYNLPGERDKTQIDPELNTGESSQLGSYYSHRIKIILED